jgi:hypothetical protein
VEEERPSPTEEEGETQDKPVREVTGDPRTPGGNPTSPSEPMRPGTEEVPEAD